jgi:hypothetical protein
LKTVRFSRLIMDALPFQRRSNDSLFPPPHDGRAVCDLPGWVEVKKPQRVESGMIQG